MSYKKSLIVLLFLSTPILLAADSPTKVHPSPVQIDSRPDMSEIWVDGKFIGTTPLPYRLTAGDHKIELVHPRYATWTRTLTVAPETPTRVAALMQESDKPCQ